MNTKNRNGKPRTALDDHIQRIAKQLGITERTARRNVKSYDPELYDKLAATPSTVMRPDEPAGLEGYEQRGDPDEPYELTKKDHRQQREAVESREFAREYWGPTYHTHFVIEEDGSTRSYVRDRHDDDDDGHTHPPSHRHPHGLGPATHTKPELSDQQMATLAAVMRQSAERNRQHPEDLVVWRLRLYCGHVVERTAHHTHTHLRYIKCPECGMDPATVVAAKALRRQDPLPTPKPKKAAAKQPSLAQQNAALRKENAELRRQLAERKEDQP